MLSIFKGTTSPSVADTILINGLAQDLTGSTVRFRMRPADAATLTVDAPAVITSAVNGAVRYDWTTTDTSTAGEFAAWWHVTLPTTATQDTPEFAVEVTEHATATGNLANLVDVRRELELPDADTTRDDLIHVYLGVASAAIMRDTEREFAPASTGVTRSFRWSGRSRHIDLAPYDLRTVTSVAMNPQDVPSTPLLVADDYTLFPVTARDGVYSAIRLSPFLVPDVWWGTRYGVAEISITGDWGFPTVPVDVRHACVLTVASWMRRDFGNFNIDASEVGREIAPDRPMNFSIPPAARRLLGPYRRPSFF